MRTVGAGRFPQVPAPILRQTCRDGQMIYLNDVPHEPANRLRFLVADDSAVNADSLSDLLRMLGHDVVTVYDGEAAIAAAHACAPDACVLDLAMPVLDGYEACRQIRLASEGRQVPIIALSGWGRREDATRAIAAGFSAVLLKPASVVELIGCVVGELPASRGGSHRDA
jgi:CheY-like chemotaxis protein